MHAATVALSELHKAVFADHLTRTLGVEWELRERGQGRNPEWAISAVPEPYPAVVMKLRAQATLSTKPEKTVHSLADLTESWRACAGEILGENAAGWVRRVSTGAKHPLLLRADDLPCDVIHSIGESVVAGVGEKRSTWRRWDLTAEAPAESDPAGRSRRGGAAPRLIAGLIPEAVGKISDEMRQALTERRELIEARADAVLEEAVAGSAPWVSGLGYATVDPRTVTTWRPARVDRAED